MRAIPRNSTVAGEFRNETCTIPPLRPNRNVRLTVGMTDSKKDAVRGPATSYAELLKLRTVAQGLQGTIAGKRIVSVTLGKTDFIDNPADIERELPGRTIRVVERYGKFLLLRLTKVAEAVEPVETALLVHLGMTGMLMPRPMSDVHEKHTHVVMLLDDGRELRYVDARR